MARKKPTFVCATAGTMLVRYPGKRTWHRRSFPKTVCGNVKDVRLIGPGDVRLSQEYVIMRVRRTDIAVPATSKRVFFPHKRGR